MSETDGRRRRAVDNRRRIVAAAAARFLERGYASTTVAEIARAAGVSPQTVYNDVGSKLQVLSAVLDAAIVGDDDDRPVVEREWVDELREAATPHAAIHVLTRGSVQILDRVARQYEVLCRAASDPAVGELLAELRRRRFADQHALVAILAASGHLRRDRTIEAAADIVFALVSEELFLLFVVERGWPVDRFESWLDHTLGQQLLSDEDPDLAPRTS